jgi:hypothetical protein
MSDIKTINISGNAAADLSGGVKKARRSTKKKQEGGSSAIDSTSDSVRGVSPIMNNVKGVESVSAIAATAASPNSNTWLKYPIGAPVPPRIIPEPSHTPSSPNFSAAPTGQYAQQPQQGGTKHIKVELNRKTTAKKVHLNPKKAEAPKQSSKKHQTKKARKVTLGISTLHKRITRAKKLHKSVKDMPLETLKEKLIKGGLIKVNSKAPESVLRQIAADAEVVKNKAL